MAGIPRPLLRKRDELARELAMLDVQARGLRDKLVLIDGAIRLLEPAWKPPKAVPKRRPTHRGRLPIGGVARSAIQALKRAARPLSTADIVAAVEKEKGLKFSSCEDREDFASSVTMAMRRCEKRGLVASDSTGNPRVRSTRGTLYFVEPSPAWKQERSRVMLLPGASRN